MLFSITNAEATRANRTRKRAKHARGRHRFQPTTDTLGIHLELGAIRHASMPSLAVLAFAVVPALADTFQTVISPSDSNFTQLLGINNAGTIAGYFGDGVVVPNNGFTLSLPSSYTPENFPGSVQTQVTGINNNSTAETVGFWIDGSGTNHSFTNVGGTFTSVSNPSAFGVTQLLGVNNSGVSAGYFTNGAGNFVQFT